MKPQDVFDVCLARYRGLRGWLGGKLAVVDLQRPSAGYIWRPERSRAAEYVADFEAAARRALRREEWKGRRKVFRVYFQRDLPYKRAIALSGVSEGTFDYWVKQIKQAVGKECCRCGLFPPSRYFLCRQ